MRLVQCARPGGQVRQVRAQCHANVRINVRRGLSGWTLVGCWLTTG